MCNCGCCGDLMKVFQYWLVAGCALLVCWLVAKPLLEKCLDKIRFW